MDMYEEWQLESEYQPGGYVIYDQPQNGYDGDKKRCSETFYLGQVLRLNDREVSSSSTRLRFDGYDGGWNSVLFTPVKIVGEITNEMVNKACDILAPEWAIQNEPFKSAYQQQVKKALEAAIDGA